MKLSNCCPEILQGLPIAAQYSIAAIVGITQSINQSINRSLPLMGLLCSSGVLSFVGALLGHRYGGKVPHI